MSTCGAAVSHRFPCIWPGPPRACHDTPEGQGSQISHSGQRRTEPPHPPWCWGQIPFLLCWAGQGPRAVGLRAAIQLPFPITAASFPPPSVFPWARCPPQHCPCPLLLPWLPSSALVTHLGSVGTGVFFSGSCLCFSLKNGIF